MVKHIVLFNVREGVDVEETVRIAASVLEPLVGKIEGLTHVEVKKTFAGMDFALLCELESREAMASYAVHPLHEEAKSHFFHLLSSRVAADYEL
ncbi:MAG: Dabb family protein [Oscillospiraceae bacterium]|nr:Dabb family protein [Oscillospiraceae bacterium]